jgi:hypothetical protein
MAYITEEQIITSQAFKAINMLIDGKVEEIVAWANHLKMRVDEAFEKPKAGYGASISIRTYEENVALGNNGHAEFQLPFQPSRLKDVGDIAADIEQLQKEVGDLQRFKLRLLNDWDFTHGNNQEQAKLFGVPLKEDADA